jgi:hypothetical protein
VRQQTEDALHVAEGEVDHERQEQNEEWVGCGRDQHAPARSAVDGLEDKKKARIE